MVDVSIVSSDDDDLTMEDVLLVRTGLLLCAVFDAWVGSSL